MHVLFLASRHPARATRGDQLRAYQHIRLLSQRHRITLVCMDDPALDTEARREMADYCERVVVLTSNRWRMFAQALAALPGHLPLQMAMQEAMPLAAAARKAMAATRFDLAHVMLARLGGVIGTLSPLPVVLDFVDALSLNMAQRAQWDRAPWSWIAREESQRLARYERELCGRVAQAAVCAARDRATIGDFPNLHCVSNGIDLAQFPQRTEMPDSKEIVFVGNLGYFPNVDAALWLCNAVMPLITDAHLSLVGARPAHVLRRAAAASERVTLVGAVPAVQPYLARAAVAVAPMRAGSGQQIKVLEAMAIGTPVVATPQTAAGMDARDGEHLLVAEDAASFAAAVNRLLSDPALGLRLATAARELVATRYSWEHSAADLEKLWITATAAAAP
jgi:sugar transferase (PEP-CTERM/EpsH1 system associated)